MAVVKIGCCGFTVSRSKYYREYSVVELQNTFYQPPSDKWFRNIRREAPESFEFTIKAWQVLTHPHTSPTWRRMRKKPSGVLENYGYLKPSRENFEAFEKMIEIAKIIESKIIVLQTPSSMPFNEESVKWVREFFRNITSIKPSEIHVGWEPRGSWVREQSLLSSILSEYNIIHVVDPFRAKPLNNPGGLVYMRLHGIGGGEVNYRYRYTTRDFEELVKILGETGFNTAYILFNNVYMFQNGLEFKQYLVENTDYEVR